MELPKRKYNRLKEYDYSQSGAYFITICTQNRACLLGNIVGATIGRPPSALCHLTAYGRIVNEKINKIHTAYAPFVTVDKYIIMPNHVHFIIVLQNGIDGRPMVAPTIPRIVQQFKGAVSKQIGHPIWQKSYHDHVIRDENEYLQIWEYIDTNPLQWADDCYHTT